MSGFTPTDPYQAQKNKDGNIVLTKDGRAISPPPRSPLESWQLTLEHKDLAEWSAFVNRNQEWTLEEIPRRLWQKLEELRAHSAGFSENERRMVADVVISNVGADDSWTRDLVQAMYEVPS